MEVPSFFTNRRDLGITFGVGLAIGILHRGEYLGGIILAMATRSFHYYAGWGATLGTFIGFVVTADLETENETAKALVALAGAIFFGAIGYGIEKAARRALV